MISGTLPSGYNRRGKISFIIQYNLHLYKWFVSTVRDSSGRSSTGALICVTKETAQHRPLCFVMQISAGSATGQSLLVLPQYCINTCGEVVMGYGGPSTPPPPPINPE